MEDTASPKRMFILEGKADEIVVCPVLEKLGILNVEFVNCNGIENLIKVLPVRIRESDMKSIGIIVDANDSLDGRWQSIRDKLFRSDLKIELLETPDFRGTILEFRDQFIGVWVMPDNQRCGELEDFVTELIPAGDVWKLACDYVESAKDKVERVSKSKSFVYAWLAIVAPGMQIGTAFKTGKLKLDAQNYKNFENWIKALCE